MSGWAERRSHLVMAATQWVGPLSHPHSRLMLSLKRHELE
jgi:hypothetical protein